MYKFQSLVRQVLFAALVFLASPAIANVTAEYVEQDGDIIVSGMTDDEIVAAVSMPESVKLRVKDALSNRSMLFSLNANGGILRVKPMFSLKAGETYILSITQHGLEPIDVSINVPSKVASVPRLVSFSPSQAFIPANTLRLYLTFSEPMARGQSLQSIKIENDRGDEIKSPFLNLSEELWDKSQTRLTLLLDPGRIKQGVGPNQQVGVPLEAGNAYRLIVGTSMKSAAGKTLRKTTAITFRVGAPERRAISINDWQIASPPAGNSGPLSIAFDRIMDRGSVMRMITLTDQSGKPMRGTINSDGGGWSLSPDQPWRAGEYQLFIDQELEDVSGNTMRSAFDAIPGTIGSRPNSKSAVIDISIPSTNK